MAINRSIFSIDASNAVYNNGSIRANNGGAITAGRDVNIESEKVTKYIKDKGWTVTGNVSLGGMLTNTDTINAAVRGGDVVGAMAGSNPTFGAIYGLSKMDSPTDFTPLINGGIRATSIANAYGQDLAIQQGAPLLGNNFENTKNALSGGPSVSIGFGTHKSETTWTESYISQFNMGSGSMTIKSGRDINLVGTQIQAEGITLDAGQKLNILADADYYKNRSSGAGVSVSYGASGWGFGVSGNKSKTDSTTYTNAGLNAGNGTLLLKSGAEMNIIGANLDGKFIDVDAKGLLTVASVQNTSHSKNSSFGVNVNQSNAASMNGSRGSSDRTFTDNLTTILGTEGVRIHSDTGTVVEGALIANATKNADGTLTDHGNLTIETPMLVWKDLEDIDVSKQIGGGINVSGDDGRSTSGTKTFSDVWDDTANGDYRKDETIGVTKATIGNGTITITDPTKQTQDIATLNRDINNVQIITKESETHISVTVPVPDSIANPIGNAGGAVANGIVDTTAAAADSVVRMKDKLDLLLSEGGENNPDAQGGIFIPIMMAAEACMVNPVCVSSVATAVSAGAALFINGSPVTVDPITGEMKAANGKVIGIMPPKDKDSQVLDTPIHTPEPLILTTPVHTPEGLILSTPIPESKGPNIMWTPEGSYVLEATPEAMDMWHGDWSDYILTNDRAQNPTKAESPVWQGLENYRGSIKTNGKSGKEKQIYEWDYTHNDIEVYDNKGKHLGSMDPVTGEMYKGPVSGRKITK